MWSMIEFQYKSIIHYIKMQSLLTHCDYILFIAERSQNEILQTHTAKKWHRLYTT